MSANVTWSQLCSTVCVEKILDPKFSLIDVEASTKVPGLLQVLKSKNISCVPVKDQQKYIGLVDVVDLAGVLSLICEAGGSFDLVRNQTLPEIVDFSELNPWIPIKTSDSLKTAITFFSKKRNLHRLPVVDDSGKVVGLLTQSRLVQFLLENQASLSSEVLNKKVEVLKTETFRKAVETVNGKQLVYLGLLELHKKEISGLAVVSDTGALLGSLSASDIKRSEPEDIIQDMHLTVDEYLKKGTHLKPIVVCQSSDTILSLLQKFVQNQVHRVFEVEEEKPIAVISLCDVISLFE